MRSSPQQRLHQQRHHRRHRLPQRSPRSRQRAPHRFAAAAAAARAATATGDVAIKASGEDATQGHHEGAHTATAANKAATASTSS